MRIKKTYRKNINDNISNNGSISIYIGIANDPLSRVIIIIKIIKNIKYKIKVLLH